MRRPTLVAAAIVAATIVSRAPFLSQQLWAWDSVLYARALEDGFHVDYALSGQRPHAPGYLFYVGAAALIRAIARDSNTALVLLSAIASALAAAALYLLARRLAGDRAAIVVALGFAADPLVWQYSEVAYPYTVLSVLSIALAAGFLAARGRGGRSALLASAALGIAAGFRQDLLVILGPLWLWTVWPLTRRARVASAACVVAACGLWLVPTAMLSGGAVAYLDSLLRQADYVRATYSVPAQGLPALAANLATTV
ncbi:MAG TPA: glycosyltransferase family 39 protein, partial [Candidatus Limnocylindria bacterium]|nr:glycosyltransferase family 39 protein [Candidatus Limnocylindria bacterium]